MIIDSKNPWNVKERDFPIDGKFFDKAKFLLSYAVLAPSSHNTQPWLFKINKTSIDIIPDYRRGVTYSDRYNRELFKSIGCCVANLIIAADHFGFSAKLKFYPESSLDDSAVRVFLTNNKIKVKNEVGFEMLCKRVTNRGPYTKETVDPLKIEEICKQASGEGISFEIIQDPKLLQEISILARCAAEYAFSDVVFKQELSEWVRSNDTKLADGMPLSGFGIPSPISKFASHFIKKMTPKLQGEIDYRNFRKTNTILIISTKDNDQKAWILGGIAYQKISLMCYAKNIATAPNAGIIEYDKTLNKLQKLLNTDKYPLFLARLGYIKKSVPHSPRRSVVETLIS